MGNSSNKLAEQQNSVQTDPLRDLKRIKLDENEKPEHLFLRCTTSLIQQVGVPLRIFEKAREYKNEKIIEIMMQFQKMCPLYRQVRGDGNCFYRSIFFLYIESLMHLQEFDEEAAEMRITEIMEAKDGLTKVVEPNSFPQVFEKFMPNISTLFFYGMQIILFDIMPMKESKKIRLEELAKFLNRYPVFDFATILLMRLFALRGLLKYSEKLKFFFVGNETEIIRDFSMEAQNCVAKLTCEYLQLSIIIHNVNRETINTVEFVPEFSNMEEKYRIKKMPEIVKGPENQELQQQESSSLERIENSKGDQEKSICNENLLESSQKDAVEEKKIMNSKHTQLHLFFRPGHYDICYTEGQANETYFNTNNTQNNLNSSKIRQNPCQNQNFQQEISIKLSPNDMPKQFNLKQLSTSLPPMDPRQKQNLHALPLLQSSRSNSFHPAQECPSSSTSSTRTILRCFFCSGHIHQLINLMRVCENCYYNKLGENSKPGFCRICSCPITEQLREYCLCNSCEREYFDFEEVEIANQGLLPRENILIPQIQHQQATQEKLHSPSDANIQQNLPSTHPLAKLISVDKDDFCLVDIQTVGLRKSILLSNNEQYANNFKYDEKLNCFIKESDAHTQDHSGVRCVLCLKRVTTTKQISCKRHIICQDCQGSIPSLEGICPCDQIRQNK